MLHGILAVGVQYHVGHLRGGVHFGRHADAVGEAVAVAHLLQREVEADVLQLLVQGARGLVHVKQGGVGEARVEREVLVGLLHRVVQDEVFDARQHVGVEVGDGLQADGLHQQVVQLDFALQAVHLPAVAPLVVGVGHGPDAARQPQCDRQPEPRVLPEGGLEQDVHPDGVRRDVAQQGRHLQPVAAGRQVAELHLAARLRLRPLLLEAFQAVAVAHVVGGGVGDGDVGETQVGQAVLQADDPVGAGRGALPVDVVRRGLRGEQLQPGRGVLVDQLVGMEGDGLVHAGNPDGAVVRLGDVGGLGLDAREAVVAVEEHGLQQAVVGDVEPVDDGHDEEVVARLVHRAYRAGVALHQHGGVVAHGVEVLARGEEDFAVGIDGHGRAGNAAVRQGDVPALAAAQAHHAVGGAHVEVAVAVGTGTEDAAQAFVGLEDAPAGVGDVDCLAGGHEQAVGVAAQVLVVALRQSQPAASVAVAGQHVAHAQQVGRVAYAGRAGQEVVVGLARVGDGAQSVGIRPAQQAAVQGARQQASLRVLVDGAQDVVVVVQAVVHEVQLEEVVDALVGGQPEVALAVDVHLADEVDAVHDAPDAAVLREAVQVVGVVYEDVPLAVGAGGHAVVRRLEAAG